MPDKPMKYARPLLAATLLSALLLATGCESLLFQFVNHGLPPPEATVVFAPKRDLALDVYTPRAVSDAGAPVVVFFYGGSWERGSREQYRFVGQRLATNGILAIVADYRTYPRAVFPGFMDDAAKAVAWSRDNAARWGGDPDRLFVAGHSAGAQIAALLGTDARYLQRYGMAPTELAGVIGLSGPYDFVVSKRLRRIFGPPEQWSRAQAVNFVDGDEPAFLLVHGARDTVVESADSVELATRLRAHDVAAKLVLLPDGTHTTPLTGLYDPQRAPAVLDAILAFVRRDRGES